MNTATVQIYTCTSMQFELDGSGVYTLVSAGVYTVHLNIWGGLAQNTDAAYSFLFSGSILIHRNIKLQLHVLPILNLYPSMGSSQIIYIYASHLVRLLL